MNRRNLFLMLLIALGLLATTIASAWNKTYRIDTPAGTDDPSEGDDRMREAKEAIQERLNVDHFWHQTSVANAFDDPNTGKHRQVTFVDPNGRTVPVPGYREGILYTRDANDSEDHFDLELYWRDDDLHTLCLTDQGTLNIQSSDLVDTLAYNTWFTAADANGEGEFIPLIKAGRNEDDDDDVAILPVGTRLESSTDPNEDCDIVPKRYLDHRLAAYIKVSDVKLGVSGGTTVAGEWVTRDINTEDNDAFGLCSLASNQITLAAGTYRCHISCPSLLAAQHAARLYNTTKDTTVLMGTAEYSYHDYSNATSRSVIAGQFTVDDDQVLEIQHYAVVSRATTGLGIKVFSDSTYPNVYTVAEFWKID